MARDISNVQPISVVRSLRAKRRDVGRQRSNALRHRLGSEFRIARISVGLTQRSAGFLAGVSQPFVSQVERGIRSPSLEVAHRLAAAIGHDLAVRLYPASGTRLRDSGQLALLEQITRQAALTWHARMEVPIADGDRRAADLILRGPAEILHIEAEGGLADLQAQVRAAQLKRTALAARLEMPVRLVVALPDRRSIREIVASHQALVSRTLPMSSACIWRNIRTGAPLGGDGILFVRVPKPERRSK
jgi:transcriptional regulator with XRE-family HTH domain